MTRVAPGGGAHRGGVNAVAEVGPWCRCLRSLAAAHGSVAANATNNVALLEGGVCGGYRPSAPRMARRRRYRRSRCRYSWSGHQPTWFLAHALPTTVQEPATPSTVAVYLDAASWRPARPEIVRSDARWDSPLRLSRIGRPCTRPGADHPLLMSADPADRFEAVSVERFEAVSVERRRTCASCTG